MGLPHIIRDEADSLAVQLIDPRRVQSRDLCCARRIEDFKSVHCLRPPVQGLNCLSI